MSYTIKQLILAEKIGSRIDTIATMDTFNDAKKMIDYLISQNPKYQDYAIFDENSQAVWRKFQKENWP